MKLNLLFAGVAVAAIAGMATTSHGRGFGGFHGGGGGFGGGNFGGGGFGGGGGFRGGGGFDGGFHGGGGGFQGGFHGGEGAGGGMRSFAGGLNGGNLHAYSGNLGGGGGGMRAYSGNFGGGARNFDGDAARMFGGNFQGGVPAFDRGAAGAFEGRSDGGFQEGGEAGAGRFDDGSNMPDTLRVSQAALPTDFGGHTGGESFSGYSGSARGLSPLESHSFDQEVSQGFASVGNAVAAAEHEGDVEAGAARRPAQSGGNLGRAAGQGLAANADRPNVANRAVAADANRGEQGRADGREAAITHGAGNDIHTLQNADAAHPVANAQRAANVAKLADSSTRRLSPADMHMLGNQIRHDYVNTNAFNNEWYQQWGGVWLAAQMGAYNPWYTANWSNVNTWYGNQSPPVNYDYGTDLTYQNNNVMLYNKPIATTQQYWQSAKDLVAQGAEQPPKDAQWLSLGVFSAIRGDESKSDMLFQLAIDKQATVRGNYFNTGDKNAQPIEGAVDKTTQRICWAVADRKNIVFDTGLYNLTQDETTLLVHFGADKTEQWTLVRLKKPEKDSGQK